MIPTILFHVDFRMDASEFCGMIVTWVFHRRFVHRVIRAHPTNLPTSLLLTLRDGPHAFMREKRKSHFHRMTAPIVRTSHDARNIHARNDDP